jgi:uncharacterized protein YlxP (DUF503 family)
MEVRMHLNHSGSLKSKRKVVSSLKDAARRRFGAAVAEIDGHDTWQRSTLLFALVGDGGVSARADELERFIAARCAEGTGFQRELRSLEDLRE